jgi:mono/diheme cytochrome c family protein
MDWIIRFTHNSAAMLKGGDPLAKQIYDENNSTCMPAFKLSDQEIRSIFNYVDSLNLGKSK